MAARERTHGVIYFILAVLISYQIYAEFKSFEHVQCILLLFVLSFYSERDEASCVSPINSMERSQ
jgi:hypothetical protein